MIGTVVPTGGGGEDDDDNVGAAWSVEAGAVPLLHSHDIALAAIPTVVDTTEGEEEEQAVSSGGIEGIESVFFGIPLAFAARPRDAGASPLFVGHSHDTA